MLSPSEQTYLSLQLTLLTQASRRSANAGREWRELSADWNEWADRSGIHDPKARADAKRVNVALNNLASTHAFWALDTQRISATIVGYVAARSVLGGGAGDDVARQLQQLMADAREGVASARQGRGRS